jgi:glycosyltransferase involved in cell wall biosynthesis
VFAAVRPSLPDLRLVQVGGPWSEAQRTYIDHQDLAPFIEQRRGISREELASLYAGATAVIVSSLAEGFGLPVIEALACGAAVIASDIPVLREVGFEGVRFCSLTDVNEWTRAIEELCRTGARPSVETRARIRSCYSWQAQARIIGDAYLARA